MLSGSNMNTPINNESVVQQVINKITDAIIAGELKPGDRIPTELELIETFHVSRNSLRSAIQTLRAYGILEVRRPEGTFVSETLKPQMLNPMLYSILLQKTDAAKDIVDLRQIIDLGVSTIIVQRGLDPEDEKRLEEIYLRLVEEIRREDYSVERVVQVDMELHQAMAEATHNSFAIMLNEFLLNLTTESRLRTVYKIYELDDREYLVRTHRDHLDALMKKPDSNLAEALKYSYYYWKDSYKW